MSVNLTNGYFVTTNGDGTTTLYEDTPIYRPQHSHEPGPPSMEAPIRPVARFKKGTPENKITEVAHLDNLVRTESNLEETKQRARLTLAARFKA